MQQVSYRWRFKKNNLSDNYADRGGNQLKRVIAERLGQCKLELHVGKTKIAYCKDANRKKCYPNVKFDFLGYTYSPRMAKNNKGKYFISFSPAVSNKAKKVMTSTMRGWKMHLCSSKTLLDLSRMFNPIMRGWINYYSGYYKSALYPTFRVANRTLTKWAKRKYKKLKNHSHRTEKWLRGVAKRDPRLFVHWEMGVLPGVEQ